MVQILDAASGFMAILVPAAKSAYRSPLAPRGAADETKPGSLWIAGAGITQQPGKRTIRTEALGKRAIEGIEFEGELTTVTGEGERTLAATEELWYSRSLGLVGLYVTSGPGGKITYRIQNVDRKDPDPSLFVIPPEYTVREIGRPASAK